MMCSVFSYVDGSGITQSEQTGTRTGPNQDRTGMFGTKGMMCKRRRNH